MFTIGSILAAVATLLGLAWKVYSTFHAKKDPTTDQLVASNTEAQDQLAQEKTANAVDTQADATRIAGDAAVLHAITAEQRGAVDGATNAAIAKQFPGAVDPD